MGQGHKPPQGPCAWEGENPKGEGFHLTWEALLPPLAAAPPQIGSEGAGPPLPCPYIYVGGGRAAAPKFWRSPPPLPSSPPLPQVLGEALQDCHAPPSPPHRCAAAGWSLRQPLLSPCWIKAWETSPGCTCVERGGAVVRRLDRNQPRSESL